MKATELVKMRTREILGFLTNNPDYQLNSREWLVFLTIAMDEGITTPQLVEQLGIPQQTVSRKLRNLGQFVTEDGELMGYNLVRVVPKGRAHSLYLTLEGQVLWYEFSDLHRRVDEKIAARLGRPEGAVAKGASQ